METVTNREVIIPQLIDLCTLLIETGVGNCLYFFKAFIMPLKGLRSSFLYSIANRIFVFCDLFSCNVEMFIAGINELYTALATMLWEVIVIAFGFKIKLFGIVISPSASSVAYDDEELLCCFDFRFDIFSRKCQDCFERFVIDE